VTSDDARAVVATCHGVVRVFGSGTQETTALRGIDVTVHGGVVTVVAGPSGSGKTSLLRLLAVQDRATAGQLEVLGVDIGHASLRRLRELRRRELTYVPQRASRGLLPTLTVAQHMAQAAAQRGVDDAHAGLLDRLGLADRSHHRPATLSGGEQQRLAVGLALVGRPRLVVADEPTAELDSDHAARVLDVMREAADGGAAVVVSSHDPRVVDRADRVLRMRHGVLSSVWSREEQVSAVIDSTGRLQLPEEALAHFPQRRVVVEIEDDRVVLRPPEVSP
jgi:ABC-type lipoprotein export system ATPase subunit